MNNKIELPIGAKAEVFGVMVECVEDTRCSKCAFLDASLCLKISCLSNQRQDKKTIILRKV